MRVLFKPVGQDAHPLEIPNTLHALQDLVGGYIETVTVRTDPKVVLICNEE